MERRPVSLPKLARDLKIGECTVYRWLEKNILPAIENTNLVAGDFAAKLVRNWKRSCTQVEAGEHLGCSATTIGVMLANKELQGIEVPKGGKLRILLSSVEKARLIPRIIQPQDIKYPGRRGFARLTPKKAREVSHKWDSEAARKASRKRWGEGEVRLYKPKTTGAKELVQSRRLVTCEAAGRLLNKSPQQMERLFHQGNIRGLQVENEILLYLHSVEVYKSRMQIAS
jgi:hypothetical protein